MQISTFLIVKPLYRKRDGTSAPAPDCAESRFEHITTKDAADYVRDGNERLLPPSLRSI